MKLHLIILFVLIRNAEQQGDLVCNFRAQAAAAAAANPTDWGILYKKPSSVEAYLHDSRSASAAWEDDPVDLSKSDISVGEMIESVRANMADHNIIAYSNFPPHARETIQCALVYKDGNGWLLTHTVNKWPDFYSSKYEPPSSDMAALLVCITIPKEELSSWGELMDYQDPFIYQVSKAPDDKSLDEIDSLKKLTKPSTPKFTPYVKNREFKSADSAKPLKFRIISKLNVARQDVYSTYLAPVLKRNLLVWSEQRSAKLLPSNCTSKYKVENVNPKEIVLKSSKETTIKRESDTSSWAISKSSDLFCISNADRTELSKNVGAGVLCFQNQNVHDIFKEMANKAKLQSCK
ncbi:Deoxyribonuclease (DNase) II [Trichuris trichiura]|uniref:Deoxyribonuclease (DNase) II n=1 Tax=Trichuris trichiura TaxID=36087 RepID=A0A077ZAT0_TRITR|nr:Deoxyribonuclease (DNase) II [Trichuris trichiura]